jgi:hypothetical protein
MKNGRAWFRYVFFDAWTLTTLGLDWLLLQGQHTFPC